MIDLTRFNSTTNYTIYLVNQGGEEKNFWCFLQEPVGVESESVFANSDAMINVIPNYQGTNSFTIPLQYVIGAGADNEAVGLDVQIDSMFPMDTDIQQSWNAVYATTPPNQGPQISNAGSLAPAGTIQITTNGFDQVKNEDNKWFSNMSFGIQSAEGFMGITWSPSPRETCTITPKFAFYISTGSYTSNSLADMDTVSTDAAEIQLTDFKDLEVTVTLTSTGLLVVTPGAPSN